jgi:hypothetical protein
LRQGAVNILARKAGALEQEKNLGQPQDNGYKCASCFLSLPFPLKQSLCSSHGGYTHYSEIRPKRVDEVQRIRNALVSGESVLMEAEKNTIFAGAQAMEVNREIQVQEVLSKVKEEGGGPGPQHEDNKFIH